MQIVTIILISLLGLFALIGAINGFKQGAPRQIIRTVTVAAAALIAVLIAKSLYTKVDGFFNGMTIQQLHDWIKALPIFPAGLDISWILNFDAETVRTVIVIPLVLIVIPLAFTAIFIPLCGLMKILHVIICGVCGLSKKRRNGFTKLLGAILGFAEGVAIAALISVPFIGLGNAASAAVTEVNQKMPNTQAAINLTNAYNGYLKPVAENPIMSTIGKCGINSLYSSLVTFDEGGKTVDMTRMLPDAALIYANATGLNGFKWQALTPENKTAINNIADIVEGNQYFSQIASDMICAMAKAYQNGQLKLPVYAPFDSVVNEAVHIFETSNPENIHTDADTILAVYYILSDEQILVAFTQNSDAMLTALTTKNEHGVTPINLVLEEIKANERTKSLITVITKISVSVMQEKLGLTTETAQVYENVKTGITETLKIKKTDYADEDQYKEAVSNSLDTTLKANGISLEPEIVDSMADYVSENFSESEEITDEKINDIILSYYDAYIEYSETGTVPDGLPEGIDPGALPPAASGEDATLTP